MLRWCWNILVALDQLANVLLAPALNLFVRRGGYLYGDPQETISSVSAKNMLARTCFACTILCKALSFIQDDHCLRCIVDNVADKRKT